MVNKLSLFQYTYTYMVPPFEKTKASGGKSKNALEPRKNQQKHKKKG